MIGTAKGFQGGLNAEIQGAIGLEQCLAHSKHLKTSVVVFIIFIIRKYSTVWL